MSTFPRAFTHFVGPQLGWIERNCRRYVLRRARPIDNWFLDRGDETLRLDYPLTSSSVVFDAGGFRGDWARSIWDRYGCTIHIFEPVKAFREALETRFASIDKIHVHPYGLADRYAMAPIAVSGDASSVLLTDASRIEIIELRDIASVVNQLGISGIDLFKINIEGAEFDLLPRLIDTGLIQNCGDVQVQFHPWVEGARERRLYIRHGLRKTHSTTYDYPFVWENWRLSTPDQMFANESKLAC